MASFRTGFKIFGEISLKQGLGRIRSFSEDRKPGQWLPEDQWAVRQPGSTCPEQCCEKPKKRAKPSKSWLSLCKDPEKPLECDIRHSNCPPPPPVKEDGPWYSLDNLIPKKKQEKPPPLQSCREEIKRKELNPDEEEVCENIVDKTLTIDIKPEHPETCMPKQEPSPAPVATLSCPLPKELNLMLWCGRPSKDTSRIAMACQSDKLPFQEFRPQKVWKAPPFSLPIRSDPPYPSQSCNIGCIPYSEFKQVEVPKPLYTRYKSVELGDSNFLLNMIDVQCPDDETIHTKAIRTFPNPNICKNVEKDKKKNVCPEKPLIAVGSVKPVRLKNAPKFEFRPKPTKLIEKRIPKNPCAKNKTDLPCRPPEDAGECKCGDTLPKSVPKEPPKVITTTLTNEPQIFEANVPLPTNPPKWMYVLCKPGSKETPLVPNKDIHPKEPDWSSETDGLKFYDGNDEQITPKPLKPPKLLDPCPSKTKAKAEGDKTEEMKTEGKKTEEKKADEKKPCEKKADEKKADEKKPCEKKAEEKKADEKKPCEKKADEKKPCEKKADEKKAEEKKVDEKKPCEKKADEKKAEENKVDEKKPCEKKADEKKAEENKVDEKKPCEKKADEKKADEMKADEKKADENKPCETKAEEKKGDEKKTEENVPVPCSKQEKDEPAPVFRDRRVLMPEKFNIKLRSQEAPVKTEENEETVEKFIESKTSNLKKSTKSITPMKENILYDLQRMCLNVPFDPTKLNAPCRKPPPPECPRPPKFYRSFSTFSPVPIKNLYSDQLFKFQRRTECGDSSGKCQTPGFTPAARECPEKPKSKDCAEITLPCCPKARFPPSCMVKRPMPPCKKRLAPKPSFSECSKDPPPCPKITECNCWEKKPGKNRKYSDWAVQRGGP